MTQIAVPTHGQASLCPQCGREPHCYITLKTTATPDRFSIECSRCNIVTPKLRSKERGLLVWATLVRHMIADRAETLQRVA